MRVNSRNSNKTNKQIRVIRIGDPEFNISQADDTTLVINSKIYSL